MLDLMKKTSSKLFINGALLVLVGVSFMVTGRIWDLALGGEKYIVGGVFVACGLGVWVVALRIYFSERK